MVEEQLKRVKLATPPVALMVVMEQQQVFQEVLRHMLAVEVQQQVVQEDLVAEVAEVHHLLLEPLIQAEAVEVEEVLVQVQVHQVVKESL